MDENCELNVCFDGVLSGSGHFWKMKNIRESSIYMKSKEAAMPKVF
jgi:hypothetical protein